jgi:Zn-dependent peptidase ImmA (M78 family)/predicted secreted protein
MPNRTIAEAHTAAQRLHARLRTDYDRPVDVFGVVKEHQIWLASEPLSGGLFGFYLRDGDRTGIVVNADHPEPLQRYTCAHELGHHILGHRSHLDEEDDIQGPIIGHRSTELAAQAFAGAFLMPLQAVNRVLRRLRISKQQPLDATDVYAVSRELDVSFSAAAWQLATLDRIPNHAADRWVRDGAAAAKRKLRPGPAPEGDNRAALFVLDSAVDGVPVLCRAGDELRLRLPENASTGHVWRLTSPAGTPPAISAAPIWDGSRAVTPTAPPQPAGPLDATAANEPLRLAHDHFTTPATADPGVEPATLGSSGVREFVFVAQQPGRTAIDAALARPWEPDQVGSFRTAVRVAPTHVLNGFSRDQMRAHAARVAEG